MVPWWWIHNPLLPQAYLHRLPHNTSSLQPHSWLMDSFEFFEYIEYTLRRACIEIFKTDIYYSFSKWRLFICIEPVYQRLIEFYWVFLELNVLWFQKTPSAESNLTVGVFAVPSIMIGSIFIRFKSCFTFIRSLKYQDRKMNNDCYML